MIYNDLRVPGKACVQFDPDIASSEDWVQLRLTYSGVLLGSNNRDTRAKHKQELRRCFHRQLKRLWEVHPTLGKLTVQDASTPSRYYPILTYLADKYERCGFRFVPLVSEFFRLSCSVDVLLLRPDQPGSLIRSGDLDNRLKTIFDALRMPISKDELGGYLTPADDQEPFFCLLEDDRLVTHVSIETDTLLEAVGEQPSENDARLVIKVNLAPYSLTRENSVFVG